MLALQREAGRAEERFLSHLRESVPQNSCVHLLGIDINIWRINNVSVTPILPAGYPDGNVYVPWVPHTEHKRLTPGPPVGRTPPPHPGSHRKKIVYVYVPFPFLSDGGAEGSRSKQISKRLCSRVGGHNLRRLDEAGSQAPAAPGTGKPGQSAHRFPKP